MTDKTFLVEIGTEELPPKALRSLAESFAANLTAELDAAGLAHGEVSWFAAPRRLALKVANLSAAQPDREVENAARRSRRRLMLTAWPPKRLKAGRAAVASPLIRPSA